MSVGMQEKAIVVLDLETTGLSPHRNAITEIAAVKIVDGEVIDSFETLINPEQCIPKFITHLTGIHDDMVKDAPLIQEVLPDLYNFIQGHTLVGHNVIFDYKFLAENFEKHLGLYMNNNLVCTAKIARRILPELPSKKLSFVSQHYGYINTNAHRAMGDVQATVHVFNKMKEQLQENGLRENELFWFQNLTCSRARQEIEKRIQQK